MAYDRQKEPTSVEQLTAYEVGSKVYDQIIAIHNNIATVANVYLIVTGVLWSAVAADTLKVAKVCSRSHPRFPLNWVCCRSTDYRRASYSIVSVASATIGRVLHLPALKCVKPFVTSA